jgi:hypothetical protein
VRPKSLCWSKRFHAPEASILRLQLSKAHFWKAGTIVHQYVITTNFSSASCDFIDKIRFLPTISDFYPRILIFPPETFFTNRRPSRLSTCVIRDVFDCKRCVTIFLHGVCLACFFNVYYISALMKLKISKMQDVDKLDPQHQQTNTSLSYICWECKYVTGYNCDQLR